MHSLAAAQSDVLDIQLTGELSLAAHELFNVASSRLIYPH